MEIINYTCVYLRSGRTVIVYGCENNREGDELIIYPDDKAIDAAVFNWDHVEMFQTGEYEKPEKKDDDGDQLMGIKDLDIPDDPGSLFGSGYL